MLIYERKTARFPYRSALEPDRACRVLGVTGSGPEWKLRLSCRHPDPRYRLPKRFAVRQTLRMSPDGLRMTVETEPALGQPARREDAFFCRLPGEEPPLPCFDREKGHSSPCEP